MANRDRTDPHRSAQAQIFRGAGQNHGNQLNAEGGKPGSDIGTTRISRDDDQDRRSDVRPRKGGSRRSK